MPDVLSLLESSMLSDVRRLEVISNNLANASTPGFKRDVPVSRVFADLLSGEIQGDATVGLGREEGPDDSRMTTLTDHHGGSLRFTGDELDIAIEGEGFFVLQGASGPLYSRQGSFSIDETGRLVGPGGLPVMGEGGEILLTIPNPRVDAEGTFWEGDQSVGQLKLVRFESNDPLFKVGAAMHAAAEGIVESEDAELRVRQGHLENANVDVMREMVLLIELMRRIEASQRVVQGYDAILEQSLRTIGDL